MFFFSCQKETIDSFSAGTPCSNDVTISDLGLYIHAVKNIPKTKSADILVEPVCDRGDTLLYIVNYEKGWEVLTADRRAPRVVAFAESGSFDYEDLSSNPAVKAVYDGVINQIRFLKRNPDLKPEKEYNDWDDVRQITENESWVLISTETEEVDQYVKDHLTETRWGQGSPWNNRSPFTTPSHTTHCYTGCGPVAAAQVLHYLHDYLGVPEKTYGDCINNTNILPGRDSLVLEDGDVFFPSATFLPYIWDLMPLTKVDSSSYFCSVSALMVHLGLLTGSEYYSNHTSTYMSRIRSTFSNSFQIGYSYVPYYSASTMYNSVHDNSPCLLLIAAYTDNPDGTTTRNGHFIIADACRKTIQRITRTYVWNSLLYGPQYKTEVTYGATKTYFGFNWGWEETGMTSGGSTIWYNSQIVSWSSGGYNFTQVEGMMFDFYAM